MSYSHAADDRLAPALQKGLQRLAKPWWRLRALNVFRDKTSLAADPALWQAIERALSRSEWFILLASPGAAQSHWVNREVAWWLRERSAARLLIVLTDGVLVWDRAAGDFDADRSTAIPPALRGAFTEEPNFVDLRFANAAANEDQRSLHHAGFRAAVLDLAAPIHGIGKDQLDGDDVRQFRRNRLFAGLAALALVVLAGAASVAAVVAKRQSDEATRRGEVALSRQLAARSQVLRADRRLDAALLHAAESRLVGGARSVDDAQMDWSDALLGSLGRSGPPVSAYLHTDGPAWPSPDGQTVAAINDDGIALWDVATARVRQRLALPPAGAHGLAWTPDSRRLLALGLQRSSLAVLDAATGREVSQPLPVPDGTHSMALSPDGRWLALWGTGGLQVRDLQSGGVVATGFPAPRSAVVSVAFDRASSLVALGGTEGEVLVVRLDTRRVVTRVATSEGQEHARVNAVALSPDGRYLVVGETGAVGVWDVPSGVRFWTNRQAGNVVSVAMHPKGTTFMTGNTSGDIAQWDLLSWPDGRPMDEKRPPRLPLAWHGAPVVTLNYLNGGDGLVSWAIGEPVLLWDLTRSHRLLHRQTGAWGPVSRLAVRADGGAAAVAGCADNLTAMLDSTCARGSVHVLGLPTPQGESLQAPLDGVPLALRYVKGNTRLLVASCLQPAADGCARVGIVESDDRLRSQSRATLVPDSQVVLALAFHPAGDRVAACTQRIDATAENPVAQLWHWPLPLAAPRLIAEGAELQNCHQLAFSDNGQTLIANLGNTTRLWRAADGQPLATFDALASTALSPDATRLAALKDTGRGSMTLQVFRVASGERELSLWFGNGLRPGFMAWRADGKLLAVAGSADGPEGNWLAFVDVAGGRRLDTVLRWSGGAYPVLQFSEGGTLLVVGSETGELIQVDLDPASWHRQACRIANRNLDLGEWMLLRGTACYRPTCTALPVPPDVADAAERLSALGDTAGAREAARCAARSDGRTFVQRWWAAR